MRTEEAARTLGERYELTEEIARGGMGVVWRGQDTLLGRPVAVKEMFPQPSPDGDDRARKRVLREARAAAALHHPGIVTVYDMLEEDDASYIVMELLDAGSLHDLVHAKGPLPVERAIEVGRQTASALRAAHEHGIMHRDVKPRNVLLLDDGRVKLADFGISSVKDDPSLTSTGEVIGSPAFMAPEQAQGEPASARTDLWGLGATLYFAVEGAPPFGEGEAIPTMRAVVHDAPEPMRHAGSLSPVISALLAKEPDARPAEADLPRLFDEAERATASAGGDGATPLLIPGLEAEPTATQPETEPATARPAAAERIPAPPRRRSWIVAAGLAAALAIAVVIGLAAFGGDTTHVPAHTGARHVATGGSHSPAEHHHADRSTSAPTTPAPAPTSAVAPPEDHAHGGEGKPEGVANGHDGGPPGNQHGESNEGNGNGNANGQGAEAVAPAPPTETETPEPTPSPSSTKESNPLQ